MGYILGLDIGIASVGWAIVNEQYEVIEAGSNIFPAGEASENVKRREFRQGRRGKRRERARKHDFEKLWKGNGLSVPTVSQNSVLELRVKGIQEEITLDELYAVLKNNLKHRGISYLDDAIYENSIGSGDYEKGIIINSKELETKLPCEIQYERLKKYGQYRGNINVTQNDEEKIILSNVFTMGAYRKEIEKIFETQRKYHPEITEELQKKYFKIFKRKRKYYEGPGNEQSRTDYGRYTTKINLEGEYITEENIFEKLIGKCSVYPEERRAAGASYTAQEFNLLNDLNNLTINDRKLEKEEKSKIVELVKTSNTINMRKIIQKSIGRTIETFSGARIDKNEKEIFHTFEAYNKMRKELEKRNIDITDYSVEDLDKIGEILTLNTDRESIISAFVSSGILCSDEFKECMIEIRKKNGSMFNKWQSFSVKIMKELIPELYEQPKNQMQLLTDMGVFSSKEDIFKDCSCIPKDLATEELYNPVVRRSVKISIDIVNAIIKKYGNPKQIVVEMPRDKNTEEEQKRIKDTQRNNEKELKDILTKIKNEYGIAITDEEFRNHKKLVLKLKLWNEQEGICPYSGKVIQINDLLHNPNLLEVDHIIPLSISFDDSRTNKVLVYNTENQKKGNRTPYMYLSGIQRSWDFDEYMNYVLSLKAKKKISSKKVDNFLFAQDITKVDVLKSFIHRNINDTRYASRVVLNTLQGYFKGKEVDTTVKVIRGSFTHQMRVNLKLNKDREESYSHHAVDAMLICFSQMGYDTYRKLQETFIDFETGEIIDRNTWNSQMEEKVYREYLYQNKWLQIRNTIMEAEKKVKFWYKVDKKCNRGLCNQTIRGTRFFNEKTYKINKLNLYTDDGIKKFKNLIEKNKQESFLMYHNDSKTFEQLMLVYEEYKDVKNPFMEYEKETGDYVRKYAKKHNGPRIVTMKYMDGEVGSCLDISHKYGHEKGSRKVILESLKPYRMDVYFNKQEQEYYFVGVKYSDIRCKGKYYVIDEEAYTHILLNEKMIQPGQSRLDLEVLGYEFKMSFYKNDIIEYEKNGEIKRERFLSRTMPQNRNYIETKPINAANFEKRNPIGLGNTKSVRKISMDILGNWHYSKIEKFKVKVDKI